MAFDPAIYSSIYFKLSVKYINSQVESKFKNITLVCDILVLALPKNPPVPCYYTNTGAIISYFSGASYAIKVLC